MTPFAWRRLTEQGTLEYRLDEAGRLVLRGTLTAPPFDTASVFDGRLSRLVPLAALGLVWSAAGGDAWELRTTGEPITMSHVAARWGPLVRSIASAAGIDDRFVLVTLGAEAGNPTPDADGFVKAPRTERGYPQRSGESDHGDESRDAEDWKTSGGAHSSHGLMQTLIGTAVATRRDLFAGVEPSRFREVLWVPENSIAIGVKYMAHFSAVLQSDPIALRFAYGAGSVRLPKKPNRWGALLFDERVPLRFIAFWNDLSCVLRGECRAAALTVRNGQPPPKGVWIALGLSCLAISAAASVAAVLYSKRQEEAAA
jgi:hypothetical protein